MTYRDILIPLPELNDPERGGWTGEPRVPPRGTYAIISRWQHPTTGRWFFLGRLRLPVGQNQPPPTAGAGGAFENEWGTDPDGRPVIVRSMIRRYKDTHPALFARFFPTAIITSPDGSTQTIRPPNVIFLGDQPEPADW